MEESITINNLSFCYPDGQQALTDISLNVYDGETIALIGPNGAGKSTLLLHLNGILCSNDGTVKVYGRPVNDKNLKWVRSRVGLVFQNPDDQALFLDESLVESTSQTLIKGSGVDMERFAILPEPHGTPLVVLPARLLWAKGVGEFVAAGQMLHDEGIDVRFALVGDSDPETAGAVPLSQLETWQRRGEVEWWGWQEDIISVFRQSHIVCLPSYYAEGVPRSLVEAAACSRPIISTDMPGCREIVHHGENGLLVPSKNINALAGAIRMLLLDPDLRQKMGARGREIAETDFSLEQVIRKNLELFGISAVDRGPG